MTEQTKDPIRICGMFACGEDGQVRNGIFLDGDRLFDIKLNSFLLTKTLNGILVMDRSTWEVFRKVIDLKTLSWQHHIVVCGGEPFELPSGLEAMIVHVVEDGYEIILAGVISGLSRNVFVTGSKKFMTTCERLFDEFYEINIHSMVAESAESFYFPSRQGAEKVRLQDFLRDNQGVVIAKYDMSLHDLSEAVLSKDQQINLTKEQADEISGLATALRRAAGEHMIKNAEKLNTVKDANA